MDNPLSDLRGNRLLALLDGATLQAIGHALEPARLELRQMLYQEAQPMTDAWFPAEGVLSMLGAASAADTPIEVGTIGSEGMLGVPLLLGAQRSPGAVFVQVEG
ncbi:MAG TPA: hypothetical protein VGD76_00725, partial [Ramlibacter sp.]